MMWPYGYGWGWMAGMWIMMVLFRTLVIVGIVVLVRVLSDRGTPAQPARETPTEILRRRYAAGELTKEQFEEMKRNVA